MTVILIVLCALGMVLKGLVKRLEEFEFRRRIETIETTAFLEYSEVSWRLE